MAIDIGSMLTQSIFSPLNFIFKATWPIWLFGLAILGWKLYQIYRFGKAGIGEVDKMDGETFENFLSSLFRKMGYLVKHVGSPAGDYGADLIIQKGGQTIAVQAKRHNSVIGLDAVRETLGSIKMYQCNSAMVVTNNYFTTQAKRLAQTNNVALWDRNILIKQILNVKVSSGLAT